MSRFKTIFCVISFFALTNCETERIIFEGPYFVRFTESARTEKESFSDIIDIEVHQSQPVLEDDITINYSISGDAREGIDYTILGERGKVIIDKGEFFGTVQIQLINNANNIIRRQDIVLTLQAVSITQLQVGQDQSAMGKSYTFTIVDDCILGGTYSEGNGSSKVTGISITSSDCENYTLSNWNLNNSILNSSIEMDLKFVDNGDNTITIPTQEEEEISPDFATIEGFGSKNPLTNEITMTITLVDVVDADNVITFTLIPD